MDQETRKTVAEIEKVYDHFNTMTNDPLVAATLTQAWATHHAPIANQVTFFENLQTLLNETIINIRS